MGDGNKVAASKDDKTANTLAVPMVRLPLGHSAADTSGASATLFHLLVPTKDGGTLGFTLDGKGEMTLFAHDGTTVVAPRTSSGHLSHTLAPSTAKKPTHGRYYLHVKGASPRKVTCTFTQKADAREGTSKKDTPIVPWNFFFWPSAITFEDGTQNPHIATMQQILRKYALAYGHNPGFALAWEHQQHFLTKGPKWNGHCHMSARASVVFEQPVAAKVQGPDGVDYSFTEEELEYLAAEWAGAWVSTVVEWKAHDEKNDPKAFGESSDVIDEDGNLVTKAAPFTDKWWEQFLKPADLKGDDEKKLKEALKQSIVAHDPKLSSEAEKLASGVASSSKKRQALKELFGRKAAGFYSALVKALYHEQQALVADLRGAERDNSPTEVWNHALFTFKASFEEVLPTDRESTKNEDLMRITVELAANKDYPDPPSTGAPATVGSDGSVAVKGLESRPSSHVLQLAFDASTGALVEKDTKNRWLQCRGEGGDELYMPAFLLSVTPVDTSASATRVQGQGTKELGNAAIELDLAAGPKTVLRLRKRYRK